MGAGDGTVKYDGRAGRTLRALGAFALLAVILAGLWCLILTTFAAVASANTSHEGWPKYDVLLMHKADQSGQLTGQHGKHNELLGGHGHDVLVGRNRSDVLWGDYKPSGQPDTQADTIIGGGGRDFIYASHGRNTIDAGPGRDYVKAHFSVGGVIDCGPGRDTLYIARRNVAQHQIRGCERISHRTLGY